MDARDPVGRLLHSDVSFASSVIAEVRQNDAEAVVQAICRTISMTRANAASVLADAVDSERADAKEEELREMAHQP